MDGEHERRTGKKGRAGRDILWLSTLGVNLVAAGAAGLCIGYFLDKWLNTRPVLIIVFFFIGTFAGFRQIYREVRRLGDEDGKDGPK